MRRKLHFSKLTYATEHETYKQRGRIHGQAVRPPVHLGEVAICSNSEYVVLRAKSAAKRWKPKGWVGSCGLVSNVPIWELFLAELKREGHEFSWIKMPFHVTIGGNNEADRTASIGLCVHPLYPFHQTQHKEATVASTPSASQTSWDGLGHTIDRRHCPKTRFFCSLTAPYTTRFRTCNCPFHYIMP